VPNATIAAPLFQEIAMGLLDSVVGALGGQQGQGGAGAAGGGALLTAVIGMLAQNQGGLAGLVQKFEQSGLGNVVGSWIGTGQNLPISADQLRNVLGSDAIGQIAQQLGLSHEEAAGQLSQALPQVVDQATPEGQLPADGGLGNLGDIGALLGKLRPS
jgi:uncharacterized protein YidB (DUF937 family)